MKKLIYFFTAIILIGCSSSRKNIYITPASIEIKKGKMKIVRSGPRILLGDTAFKKIYIITKN